MRLALLLPLAVLLAACGGTQAATPTAQPSATSIMSFSHAPAMTINTSHTYTATVTTSDGAFTITLLPKVAPLAVNNFVFLARHHFYDNVIFHRIVKDFVVQTGDPTGTGTGNPGYTFKIEHTPGKYTPGTVAMANSGTANSNGSQFFIVSGSGASTLQPNYTIFGRVTHGMSVIRKLNNTATEPNPSMNGELSEPVNPPVVKSIVIHESA